MGDIAHVVGIGASALYRHFPSKQNLLGSVVGRALDSADGIRHRPGAQPVELAERIASTILEQRSAGMLWRREARHLTPVDQAAIRNRMRDIGARLASYIRTQTETTPRQADLLA